MNGMLIEFEDRYAELVEDELEKGREVL